MTEAGYLSNLAVTEILLQVSCPVQTGSSEVLCFLFVAEDMLGLQACVYSGVKGHTMAF